MQICSDLWAKEDFPVAAVADAVDGEDRFWYVPAAFLFSIYNTQLNTYLSIGALDMVLA